MKKKKKVIVTIGIVAVLAVIGVMVLQPGKSQGTAAAVPCTTLKKTSVSNTVNTSGVIQSTDSVNVYTDLTYTIKTLNIKVGDHVSAGQVLCELDSKELQDTISQKLAAMQTSSKQTAQKIQSSQKKYNDTKSTLSAGLNAQINDAADKVISTQRALETAQQKLTDAQKHLDTNTDSQLISAKSAVESAKLVLDSAQKAYNDAKDDYDDDGGYTTKEALHDARDKLNSAQLNYETAQKTLTALNTTTDESISDLKKDVTTAQTNYESALKTQKAILVSVNQDLSTAADNVTTDKLSADQSVEQTELESLQTKLSKCSVTAPATGIVTAVYAVKNAPASGLLFVIEDVGALKMTVKIKEYDISSVKVGMKAIIKADAISDKEFEGYVEKISPTSLKGADGKTASSTDAEFEADVAVVSQNSGLLIGMNGTSDIVLEKKDNVYSVPFDAVTAGEKGQNIVYSVTKQKDGSYLPTAIPVTTGIETDAEIEISGSGLKDGLQIVSDGKTVTPGKPVQITAEGSSAASSTAG